LLDSQAEPGLDRGMNTGSLGFGLFAAGGLLLTGCEEKKAAAAPAAASDNYPLKVCVVSGEPLGSMGEPAAITYEGTTVKFCCSGCEEDFRKEPATYLAKLTSAPAQP